jgi:hypothetical protein
MGLNDGEMIKMVVVVVLVVFVIVFVVEVVVVVVMMMMTTRVYLCPNLSALSCRQRQQLLLHAMSDVNDARGGGSKTRMWLWRCFFSLLFLRDDNKECETPTYLLLLLLKLALCNCGCSNHLQSLNFFPQFLRSKSYIQKRPNLHHRKP